MVDSVVTWFTNDQRFTPFRNHALLPPFLPIEIFDFPYMVQLKQFSLRCTAQLTNSDIVTLAFNRASRELRLWLCIMKTSLIVSLQADASFLHFCQFAKYMRFFPVFVS